MLEALLQEFEHEMTTTRKYLEIIPEKEYGWKPHEKSMTLGRLAAHLAEIPSWTEPTFHLDELDLSGYKPTDLSTSSSVLKMFDQNVVGGAAALKKARPEQFNQMWALKFSGKVLFSMPKLMVYRSFVLNHTVHHRGQLSVYLRLRNVPLPKAYGPTADDTSF